MMIWSRAAACSVTFLLLFLRAAPAESSQQDMDQRPLDLWEIWEPIEHPDMEQREILPDPDVIQALRKKGSQVFPDRPLGPRSFTPPDSDPFLQILFPPARPSVSNLQAICFQDNRRPRYPVSSLPQSSFGYLHRQAAAINRVESWYSKCCQGNQTQDQEVTLCCVKQAWEENLKQYCEEEFSIKTSHYHCCKKQGEERLSCFHGDAPNPTYQDPEEVFLTEPGFTFDPNTCQKYTEKTESSGSDGTNMTLDLVANDEPQGLQVPFPPAQPSAHNLRAICFLGNRRPRYSARALSSAGHLIEAGNAINRVESWYSKCCQGNQTQDQEVTLCCVKQAWEENLKQYCEEAAIIQSPPPPCCLKEGDEQLSCFHGDAPNPTYQDLEEFKQPGFTFDPKTCQRPVVSPRSIQDQMQLQATKAQAADINFPPGRPTGDNIQAICRFGKLRPLYLPRCLPRKGYGWLTRQSKAVNRLEKGFKQCCKRKKNVVSCADGKWREVVDKFCEEEGESSGFSCCLMVQGDERYACFSGRAPHPGYGSELHGLQGAEQEPSLGQICRAPKVVKKKLSKEFPVQILIQQCCPLPGEQSTTCVEEKLATLSESLCLRAQSSSSSSPSSSSSSPSSSSSSVHGCCSSSSQDSKCFSKLIMDAVTKTTRSPRPRRRKCPLLAANQGTGMAGGRQ